MHRPVRDSLDYDDHPRGAKGPCGGGGVDVGTTQHVSPRDDRLGRPRSTTSLVWCAVAAAAARLVATATAGLNACITMLTRETRPPTRALQTIHILGIYIYIHMCVFTRLSQQDHRRIEPKIIFTGFYLLFFFFQKYYICIFCLYCHRFIINNTP